MALKITDLCMRWDRTPVRKPAAASMPTISFQVTTQYKQYGNHEQHKQSPPEHIPLLRERTIQYAELSIAQIVEQLTYDPII